MGRNTGPAVRFMRILFSSILFLLVLQGCGVQMPNGLAYGTDLPTGEPPAGDGQGNTSPPTTPVVVTGPDSSPQIKTSMNLVPGA